MNFVETALSLFSTWVLGIEKVWAAMGSTFLKVVVQISFKFQTT
jgi:hypothetical protein